MSTLNDLVRIGSQTARDGFANEDDIVYKFNNWKYDDEAQEWLETMGYKLQDIEYVFAIKLHGYKTDVQVQVTIKLMKVVDAQNIQVKLVTMGAHGLNQIDKRWVDSYVKLWNIPANITRLLKLFTGEIKPYHDNVRDSRRMYLDEFSRSERESLLTYLSDNKTLIVNDILKGRGQYAAEWTLVVHKLDGTVRWILAPMNFVLNFYGNGSVRTSPRKSILIGRITMKRKGGDGGRSTANMLQFQIDPILLFDAQD